MKPMKVWYDCSHKERIERWENAERVLKSLSPHERRHHWNMGWWGEKTPCGTVACAGGHCAMDPWFRRRGLRMDFRTERRWTDGAPVWDTEFDSSDIETFFGFIGSHEIFFRGQARPVSKVIKEIRAYTKRLRADTEDWEGQKFRAVVAEE